MPTKVIFHIDMNCFFASCEIAENPSLKGKKVVVAHDSLDKKGMVLTASYEAKNLGIKTTWPLFKALQVCPDLTVVEPKHELYEKYSNMFFEYFYSLTSLVEPASIDEAYLDVTDLSSGSGYLDLAKEIQNTLLYKYKLPCSIGIAPNKFLAKMASDMKKPLGITVLRRSDIPNLMWPLPIEDFFGCGKKTSAALRLIGINTIGDLANYKDVKRLENYLGEASAIYLLSHANGDGSDIVDTTSWQKVSSISNDYTLDHNEYNADKIMNEIKKVTMRVSKRLNNKKMSSSNISLVLKFDDFKTLSKSITLPKPISSYEEMIYYVTGLFDEIFTGEKGVRLVSVHCNKLVSEKDIKYRQLTIFDEIEDVTKNKDIDDLIENINEIFGEGTVRKGI